VLVFILPLHRCIISPDLDSFADFTFSSLSRRILYSFMGRYEEMDPIL